MEFHPTNRGRSAPGTDANSVTHQVELKSSRIIVCGHYSKFWCSTTSSHSPAHSRRQKQKHPHDYNRSLDHAQRCCGMVEEYMCFHLLFVSPSCAAS